MSNFLYMSVDVPSPSLFLSLFILYSFGYHNRFSTSLSVCLSVCLFVCLSVCLWRLQGVYFKEALQELSQEFPEIIDVTGTGLLVNASPLPCTSPFLYSLEGV